MKQLLIELESLLKEINPDVLDVLQSGEPESHISDAFRKIGVSNESLTALYRWRNGVSIKDLSERSINELELFPGLIMLSAEDAINRYILYTKEKEIWSSNLLPVFTDGGGDYLLLDIGKDKENSGMLFFYSPSQLLSEKTQTIYDSLEHFLKTAIKCLRRGAYNVDSEGNFDVDYDLKYEISAELNPRSNYWNG